MVPSSKFTPKLLNSKRSKRQMSKSVFRQRSEMRHEMERTLTDLGVVMKNTLKRLSKVVWPNELSHTSVADSQSGLTLIEGHIT